MDKRTRSKNPDLVGPLPTPKRKRGGGPTRPKSALANPAPYTLPLSEDRRRIMAEKEAKAIADLERAAAATSGAFAGRGLPRSPPQTRPPPRTPERGTRSATATPAVGRQEGTEGTAGAAALTPEQQVLRQNPLVPGTPVGTVPGGV